MPIHRLIRCRHGLPVLLLGLLAPLTMSGCFSYHRAKGETRAPAALAAGAWPQFETESLEPLVDVPEVIERYEFDIQRLPTHWRETESEIEIMRRYHTGKLLFSRLDDHGLIRVWRDGRRSNYNALPSPTERSTRTFDRNGRYLTVPIARQNQREREIDADYGGGRGLKIPTKSMYGLIESGFASQWKLDEGFELAIPEVIPDNSEGLILHITGMFQTKYEHALTNRLRGYGYAAAYLESDPFLDSPLAEEEEIVSATRQKRFYELVDEEVGPEHAELSDLEKNGLLPTDTIIALYARARQEFPSVNGFAVTPDTDVAELGRSIAELSDELISTHAYAAEALIRATDEMQPTLRNKPIVIMAYSAGALSAPAVAARLTHAFPDRQILLVLIGGGGDLITIASRSVLSDMVMDFAPEDGPAPTEDQIGALRDSYLNHANLDPLVIAPAISDIPTLHIYADRDTVVPTIAAQRFNAAHGHVDRLVYHGNHGTLFYFLQGQAGKVRSWLRAQGIQ